MLPYSVVGAPLEMTKKRWKESMQMLFDKHFDPTKDEELKQSKREIENKLPKIVKLVKERRLNRRNRNTEFLLRKESELIELIEDFHRQYQFVYDLYDHLRGQLSQTVKVTKEDEGYFTATSPSTSDSESDTGGPHHHHHRHASKQNGGAHHTEDDKESLSSEYAEVTNKVKESEKILQRLEAESRTLRKRLNEKEQQIVSIAYAHKRRQKETLALHKALELELGLLNSELGSICTEKPNISEDEEAESNRSTLQDNGLSLEKAEREIDRKLSPLVNGGFDQFDRNEGFEEIMSGLIAQMSNLRSNVSFLSAQKSNFALHEKLADQVAKMKQDLGNMRKTNAELESKLKKTAQENSGFLTQINDLKKRLAYEDVDIQKLLKEKDESLVRIHELQSELHGLCSVRAELKKQNSQLQRQVEELRGKMFKREKSLKESEDHFSALQKQLEDPEDSKPAQIVALTAQITHLEQELELKSDLESQIQTKDEDIEKLTQQKEVLQGRVSELEKLLEDKSDELDGLKSKMSAQILALTREVSEKEQETHMKQKLEEQISAQEVEIGQLGEEKQALQAKVLELEINLTEKEDEIAALQRRVQMGENERAALSSQIDSLENELSNNEQEFMDRLTQLEKENNAMKTTIKQQEDEMSKLKQDCKAVKTKFLQAADRKMDEMAEDFRKYFEDNLRILSRRIRVAEQLHTETKDSFKRLQEECEQEHPGVETKVAEAMELRKRDLDKISSGVLEMMRSMETIIRKYETKQSGFMERLSGVSEEVQVTRKLLRWTMEEAKNSNETPIDSNEKEEQDKVMEEKVKGLEAKVKKITGEKMRLMKGMYELQRKVGELEKVVVEKEEGLSTIREEKMEAIRQLCLWIDYHQSRFDDVKDMLQRPRKNMIKS